MQLFRLDPHISNARTIDKNSRTEIWYSSHSGMNAPKNYFVLYTHPKPALLASVTKCRDEGVCVILDTNRALPLKLYKNICQALRSARASKLSLVWWYGLDKPMVWFVKRLKKVRPGGTTLQAKFSNPIRDCNSKSVTDHLFWRLANCCFKRINLSWGNLISNSTVSNSKPKKSGLWKGRLFSKHW